MKLRPVQLVCLALLLAALRLADPTALAPQEFALRAGVLQALLGSELEAQSWVATTAAQAQQSLSPRPVRTRHNLLPAPLAAQIAIIWPSAPPALQSASLQVHTSLLRA